MTEYLFDRPAVPCLAVRDEPALYPIRRIFFVGHNYEAHAKEVGVVPDRAAPFYFTKSPLHSVASGATLVYPPGTLSYHYEIELVIAMGAPAFQVNEVDAWHRIFGYACGLDMTRRDPPSVAREKLRPWDLNKDFEDSVVLAPLVRAAEVGHLTSGKIELKVNGVVKQSSDLSRLIHPVPAIIADLSQYYHLDAGDLIYTGTPEGVGSVQSGDTLEGSIAGLGTIRAQIG